MLQKKEVLQRVADKIMGFVELFDDGMGEE